MNLLPQKEIKALRRETSMRFIIVVCFLLAILEAVAIFLLIPSYVLVRAERNTLSSSVEQLKQSISGKGSVDDELKIVGSDIKDFLQKEDVDEKKTTEIIDTILALRPKGVSTNSISVIQDVKGTVISMTGVGVDRNVLIDYQRILASKDFINEAKYAEKFIMKKSNINYTLMVSLK